jgi:hypothetical protein
LGQFLGKNLPDAFSEKMEKYFELKQKGFKLKFTKKNNKFVVCGSYGKIFLESSGEKLEDSMEKFCQIAMELVKEFT